MTPQRDTAVAVAATLETARVPIKARIGPEPNDRNSTTRA
jgi:hypothetical protein